MAWRPSHLSQHSFPSSLELLLPLHLLTYSVNVDCDDDVRHAAAETDAAAAADENDDDDNENFDGKAALLAGANEAVPRECGRVHCGMVHELLLQLCAERSAEWGGLDASVRETQQPMRKGNGVVGYELQMVDQNYRARSALCNSKQSQAGSRI